MKTELRLLLNYLNMRGHRWTKSNRIQAELGPQFSRRAIAALRDASRGKIISSRGNKELNIPTGYKLTRHASPQEFNYYLGQRRKDREAIEQNMIDASKEWHRGRLAFTAGGQATMRLSA